MNYIEVKFKLGYELSELLADVFLEKGALSVAIENADYQTQNEYSIYDETTKLQIWDNTVVIALFTNDVDVDYIISSSLHQLDIDLKLEYEVNVLPDEDWIKKTQSQFKAVKISDNLWIIPSWSKVVNINAINIRIDPGLAFGTGTHPTTNLCLSVLNNYIVGGESVLDYGCGSGILAIASKKLGANKVIGVDVDKVAIQVSTDNAISNQEKIDFYLSDNIKITDEYDIVIANILTNPLKILGDLFAKYTKKNGYIILSGILDIQEQEIELIYSTWFKFKKSFYKEGWVCILGKKI